MSQDIGRSFKVILVGGVATGKTSIINKLISDSFDDKPCSTQAPAFFKKTYKFDIFDNITQLEVIHSLYINYHIDMGYSRSREIQSNK